MYVWIPYLESQNIPNLLTEWLQCDTDKSVLKWLDNRSEMIQNGVIQHGMEPESM